MVGGRTRGRARGTKKARDRAAADRRDGGKRAPRRRASRRYFFSNSPVKWRLTKVVLPVDRVGGNGRARGSFPVASADAASRGGEPPDLRSKTSRSAALLFDASMRQEGSARTGTAVTDEDELESRSLSHLSFLRRRREGEGRGVSEGVGTARSAHAGARRTPRGALLQKPRRARDPPPPRSVRGADVAGLTLLRGTRARTLFSMRAVRVSRVKCRAPRADRAQVGFLQGCRCRRNFGFQSSHRVGVWAAALGDSV